MGQAPDGRCVRLFAPPQLGNSTTCRRGAADYEITCHLRFDCRGLLEGVGGIGVVTNHAAIRSRTARSFAVRRSALKTSPLAAALRRVQVAERSNHRSLLREREIAAISTLAFDSCRSRYPSDLSKSAQVQLPKNAEISGDYKFRTKTPKYRALEKNGRRERISGLSASLTVQRFAD